MGHLDSQRSLPVIRADKSGLSNLARKLRLTPEQRVAVINAPGAYLEMLHPGPPQLDTTLQPGDMYDAVLLFVKSSADLRRLGPDAIRAARAGGLLWIAYPKGGAGTDLPATPWWMKRDVLGEITSETGFKPVAFVAVDDTYTALRFKRL